MLDIMFATGAVNAASKWATQAESDGQSSEEPASFTGLELLSVLGAGGWPSIPALAAASVAVDAAEAPRGAVITDGVTVGVVAGYGKAVVPAARTWNVVDLDPTRWPQAFLVPTITYTGRH
ncbi:hypothetical protein D1871_11140 [Nakamurella silvestris]|nr:hypothetical protein D1871_11140 [Nakamurella silvestris]